VDSVRKREHRALTALGDETLKGSKSLAFTRWRTAGQAPSAVPRVAGRRAQDGSGVGDQGESAGAVDYRSYAWAKRHWQPGTSGHPLAPGPDHRGRPADQAPSPQLLAYFDHPITNAVAEGLNSKIRRSRGRYGFRNPAHFKIAVFFHCGGLDLYPATHGNPDEPTYITGADTPPPLSLHPRA